jgi:hypothetical protein
VGYKNTLREDLVTSVLIVLYYYYILNSANTEKNMKKYLCEAKLKGLCMHRTCACGTPHNTSQVRDHCKLAECFHARGQKVECRQMTKDEIIAWSL